jgi:hypothetical protein
MFSGEALPAIAHAIQLAIAPVFLLTGIAGLLGVMANRLARVIDRGRWLEQAWRDMDENARAVARAELAYLERRRKFASWSINFCTAAALLVCLVIAVLFADEFFAANLRWVEGALFVLAMMAVIGGLASFLREVYLATHSTSLDPARFEIGVEKPVTFSGNEGITRGPGPVIHGDRGRASPSRLSARSGTPPPSAVTPIRRETRIGTSARCNSATRCCRWLSAIVIRERSRTYSAHDSIT